MFQFAKPVRTYGRKKEVIISIPKLVIPSSDNNENKNHVPANKNINRTETEEVDNSLIDDPFETTFDKLFKNMRIPPPVHKADNDTILLNSSDDKTTINDHKSSLHEVDDFNAKPIPKRKMNHRKSKVKVIKKTIKKKIVFQNNGKFKKDNSHKYKLREKRNNSKISSKYFDIDCLSFIYDERKISEIKNYNQDKRKVYNKKPFVGKKKRGTNMSSVKFSNDMEVKPCFVNLGNSNISKWNTNAIENNLSNGTHQLSNQYINTDINIDNLEHNNTNMKHCFIKLEQLEIDSYKKPLNFNKKNENVFNSTPNSRSIRPSAHLISLSPISVEHFEKLGDSNIYANNALPYRNNEACLGSELVSDDLCKKSNEVARYELEDKSKSLFNSLSNISNLSKCNLNKSENTDKKYSNLLTKLSCNTNANYNQKEFFTKEDLVQDNSKSGIKQSDINKLILTQEHKIPSTKTSKHYLRFSVDANKSCSLFDDSNENNTKVHNIEKKCNSNIAEDEKRTVLINEMLSDFIKLDEKPTLNINYDKEVIFNKIEELPETLIPIKLTTSDSSVDITIELKTEEISNKTTEIVDDVSCQILSDSKNILNTKNSPENSCMKHNILQSYVVLEQLQDPVRVTKRKKYTKWDLDLVAIAENCNDNMEQRENQVRFKKANNGRQMLSQKKLSVLENIMEESTNNGCINIKNPIYLKPGKSWARSLSILNNVHTEFNLDELSVGKGKKWRHSVQDILNMQTQGIIQSCIKKNDKKLQITNELTNKSYHELINNKGKTYDSTNLSRVSRRISIRVVPICKTVKSIEDAPFLEVYGIVPIKSQRFTLLNNPQKSSTCKIQSDDIDDQIIEEHIVSTAREVILQRCLQKDYIPFSLYFSDSYLQHCRKIGEGVYGEVFLYEQENKKSVIKIIPIEGNDCVNGEPQKKFHEILSEIVIAMELHSLRFNTNYNTDGFVEVKNIKCIKGKYPEKLLELWNIYDEEKHSDNDCPSIFNDDQLYIVLELAHGGQDLEAFVFNTAEEAHILFIQTALALAVAEKAVEFEHRDLHWGNILISPTDNAYVHYKFGQKNIELISKGVKVSIIDFTLSRIQYQGCSIFNDLASDPTLFTAQGEYQFEIYRLMKNKVKNNWQIFEPYTNILWLHYTLDKMITAVRYRKRNLKIHKNGIIKLKELKNEVLKYNSAFDLITNCDKIVNLLHVNS
ncbi:Putative serine/threonine-protein kinase haspin like protein [Eufriesea mexicana]|uniref:non-specific serine/threonine protein kinase n=1 Tax=Eufriesea mexicana TaxID=516756 RepID=A0A310SWW5_9HYME|nr:Putative serine/threonine-protein kinase haspin like protein [Eufriesea mexicana]